MARPYQSRKKVEAAVVHQYLRYCHSGEQEQHHLGGFAYVSEEDVLCYEVLHLNRGRRA